MHDYLFRFCFDYSEVSLFLTSYCFVSFYLSLACLGSPTCKFVASHFIAIFSIWTSCFDCRTVSSYLSGCPKISAWWNVLSEFSRKILYFSYFCFAGQYPILSKFLLQLLPLCECLAFSLSWILTALLHLNIVGHLWQPWSLTNCSFPIL